MHDLHLRSTVLLLFVSMLLLLLPYNASTHACFPCWIPRRDGGWESWITRKPGGPSAATSKVA